MIIDLKVLVVRTALWQVRNGSTILTDRSDAGYRLGIMVGAFAQFSILQIVTTSESLKLGKGF